MTLFVLLAATNLQSIVQGILAHQIEAMPPPQDGGKYPTFDGAESQPRVALITQQVEYQSRRPRSRQVLTDEMRHRFSDQPSMNSAASFKKDYEKMAEA